MFLFKAEEKSKKEYFDLMLKRKKRLLKIAVGEAIYIKKERHNNKRGITSIIATHTILKCRVSGDI